MEEDKFGYILINKPSGPTSHDIINKLRKITAIKKIGHAGTLDPFANGLLIVAIGRKATREINKFVKLDKVYEAELFLGAVSDTYDRTGVICEMPDINQASQEEIEKVLKGFVGEQKQIPPMFSAKKVKGRKLYQLARQGIEIDREENIIQIEELKIIRFKWPKLVLRVRCSSGTYVRTLAHDIGNELKCGAYLNELKRTAVGEYKLKNAYEIESINNNNWTEYLFL